MDGVMMAHKRRKPAFWVGLLIFSLHLLTFSGSFGSIRALTAFTAANNLAQYGRADSNLLIWADQQQLDAGVGWGQDGHLYPKISRWLAWPAGPLAWLGHRLPGLNALYLARLIDPLLAALACGLLLVILDKWGQPVLRQLFFSLALGLIWRLFSPLFLSSPDFKFNPIWLSEAPAEFPVALHLLLPPLIIFGLAIVNLWAELTAPAAPMRPAPAVLLSLLLVGQMMLGAAHLGEKRFQTQVGPSFTATLSQTGRPGDVLLVTGPRELNFPALSEGLLGYQDMAYPTFLWLEQQDEPADLLQAAMNGAARIWLFEPTLGQNDPLGPTAARLRQQAFLVGETWFQPVGRLGLYALTDQTVAPHRLAVDFERGLSLLDFSHFEPILAPGQRLKLRLTWQMADQARLDLAQPPLVAFLHLLDDGSGQTVAQTDRILVDIPNHHQSPLWPGQTVSQGYSLPLPQDLPPGAYSVIVGLYEATTLRRLGRVDGSSDDFLYLTTVQVTGEGTKP